jgi:hypothetical protein
MGEPAASPRTRDRRADGPARSFQVIASEISDEIENWRLPSGIDRADDAA